MCYMVSLLMKDNNRILCTISAAIAEKMVGEEERLVLSQVAAALEEEAPFEAQVHFALRIRQLF